MFVANAIAVRRHAKRREAFHETCRQPPKPAVAKRRIRLVCNDGLERKPSPSNTDFASSKRPRLTMRVFQQPPDQELHRQVIDALGLTGRRSPRVVANQRIDDAVTHRQRQCGAPIANLWRGQHPCQAEYRKWPKTLSRSVLFPILTPYRCHRGTILFARHTAR